MDYHVRRQLLRHGGLLNRQSARRNLLCRSYLSGEGSDIGAPMTASADDRVSLVAAIGPVEPRFLTAFLTHYLGLGIRRCILAFHFPADTEDAIRTRLRDTCRDIIGDPLIISVGPWHETTHPILIDELRAAAGEGWHLLADVDEFQFYPLPLTNIVTIAETTGDGIVQGLLFDRMAIDGRLASWPLDADLDLTYPLGGFFTHLVLGGDPRKIVLAHSGVDVVSGNHYSPGRHATNDPIIPVHHFKWQDSVISYLRKRVAMLHSGEWHETSPAPRLEAGRFLSHYHTSGGRVAVQDPHLNFRPTSLTSLPPDWERESRVVIDTWQQKPYPKTALDELQMRKRLNHPQLPRSSS